MVCRKVTLLCWCLITVIVRNCQPTQSDLSVNRRNNHALHKDVERTPQHADLEAVDTQRMPVIRRKYDASAAEVEQAEGEMSGKIRAAGLEEEETEEEEEVEEEEEEWLPVNNGEGKQKISEVYRDEKRVKRESDQRNRQPQEERLQYTTLHARNHDYDAEEGNGGVDTSEEDSGEKEEGPRKAKNGSERQGEGSEEGRGTEGETVQQQDGDVHGKADAQSDDTEEEEETPAEDDATTKQKIAEADDKQKKKVTSKEDASREDTSEERTSKEDSSKDDTSKEDASKEDTSKEDTSKEDTSKEDTLKRDGAPTQDDANSKADALEKDDLETENVDLKKDYVLNKNETQMMDEKRQETRKRMENKKSKEESKVTRVNDTMAQNEGFGDSDEYSEDAGGRSKEGKGKEPVDDDDDGSGDDEDKEEISFLREASADSTESDDSPANDAGSEEQGDQSDLSRDDDEAKKQPTATLNEDNEEEEKEKESPTQGDKHDDDESDSNISNENVDEGSGEEEEEEEKQNIEPRTGSEKESDHADNEQETDEYNGTATKDQWKSNRWQYYGAYGPGNWSKEFIGCSSSSDHLFQSPINILPEQTRFDDTREKITFTLKHNEEMNYKSVLLNDAKTAKVIFEKIAIHVNGLDRIYQVAWVQFHWGNANNVGSEHTVAGTTYPLEMQVLCYDEENFPDVIEAEWMTTENNNRSSSTIVMLATLFEISGKDNQLLSPVVENLKSIQSPGENTSIPFLDLNGLLQKNSDHFYSYSGSLTSPPCQGGADWIVFHERQTISPSQLAKFRQLHEEDFEDGHYSTIDDNWRPIQPLNGRIVTRSFPIPKKEGGRPKTPKPSAVKTSSRSSSQRSPAINISSLCTLLFVWKMFLG